MVAQRGIKATLFTSTILLALVGTVVAEERDPRLKDPTIDFNTVELSTLPPLQFTFVPEWRKLEGFRRFVFGRPMNVRSGQSLGNMTEGEAYQFCEGFWEDLRTGSNIVVVEPILQTNFVSDIKNSPLEEMCPNFDFEYMDGDRSSGDLYRVRYGVKVYDISDTRKSFIYEIGAYGRSSSPSPDTPEALSNQMRNAKSWIERRLSSTYLFYNKLCKRESVSYHYGQTPFMMADHSDDLGLVADNLVIGYRKKNYILSVFARYQERSAILLDLSGERDRPACEIKK